MSEINDHLKHADNSATKKGTGHIEMTDIYSIAHLLLWYHTSL
jgi:hypothetical protein